MRSSWRAWILFLFWAWAAVAQTAYKVAVPGYKYEFPRDYFNHPDYQTEWWYYTGNVAGEDGRRFGFELTFFRVGVNRDETQRNTWDIEDLYVAHLALSDLDGKNFYHTERTNRAGPGIAGVDAEQKRIWNGNWSVSWDGEDQVLEAVDERVCFSLKLHPEKPPVIQGENGVSQKGAGAGRASYYISLTRLKTNGILRLDGKKYAVSGLTWMDHEFFTNQLEKEQVGWDWFSVQLGDHTELMLYRIRRADRSVDPYSSGTFVDASGRAVHLGRQDFSLMAEDKTWKSPATGAEYPAQWHISVPNLNLELEASTALKSQELSGKSQVIPNYWEGAIQLDGRRGTEVVTGVGYLEMTGYDRAVKLGEY
jgi:predicted secreted hydrolase